MCTLTFIPRDDGYILAMNRDERIVRSPATPPALVQVGETRALYPTDIEGGTWIGINEHGVALGLLNRNVDGDPLAKIRSRGEIIPMLLRLSCIGAADAAMQNADLGGILPFRLIGVSTAEKAVVEWRWDQHKLESATQEWKAQHWFSSSLSDGQAGLQRNAACAAAWNEPDAGLTSWLRRLHASHGEGPGPFSICVHREEVETLSYTEVSCSPDQACCHYFPGSPCVVRASGQSTSITRMRTQSQRGWF
jgi:hypothetical protein